MTRDGCPASCRMVWRATTVRDEVPNGSPVLGFRSNEGKRLLVMSTRMRWPLRNRLLVTIWSMTNSAGSSGVSGSGEDSEWRGGGRVAPPAFGVGGVGWAAREALVR